MERIELHKSNDSRRITIGETVLVAHQPQFLPWLGFISKATMGDVYVIHDLDQYKKETYENRNRIRIKNEPGWQWLIAHVLGTKNNILNMSEIKLSKDNWRSKVVKTIELSYARTPYFGLYFSSLRDLFYSDFENLVDLNLSFINFAFSLFEIQVPVYRASELVKSGYEIDLKSVYFIRDLCKIFNADVFVAGQVGKTYIDTNWFDVQGIKIIFQKFNHPHYKQLHGDFHPFMSFIDILFNHGPESIKILGKSDFELK